MTFTDRELTALAEILSWYHRDRVIMGRPEQAELIKRLIQEIDKKKGSSNDH